MRRAVLRWCVLMCCRERVSTRKTARAGKYCICAHLQARTLRVTLACPRSHPHPSRGFGGHINITQRGLCAMRSRAQCGSIARIICAMSSARGCIPATKVSLHIRVQRSCFIPPTHFVARSRMQLIPLLVAVLRTAAAPRAARFVVARVRTACGAHAREERRSRLSLKVSIVLAASRASE